LAVQFGNTSGKIAYAVVSFGGFLGMGEEYYPMLLARRRRGGTFGVHQRYL
jgi:hypothetical protein